MKTRIVSTATVATLVISALSMHEKALATLVESQPSLIKPQGPDGAQTDSVMRLLSKKEYDEALDAAQKTIQSSPDDPRGYTMQGAAYFGKQDLKHARESFEKALKLRKDYEPALLGLAEIDLRENKYSVARDRYQAVLAKDPGSVPAMLGMARVESANKNESESVAWVERAKLSRPDALVPRLLLAGRYIDKREYDKALAELTEARRFHPNEPRVLDMRGQVQAAQGKYDDAVSTFKK